MSTSEHCCDDYPYCFLDTWPPPGRLMSDHMVKVWYYRATIETEIIDGREVATERWRCEIELPNPVVYIRVVIPTLVLEGRYEGKTGALTLD